MSITKKLAQINLNSLEELLSKKNENEPLKSESQNKIESNVSDENDETDDDLHEFKISTLSNTSHRPNRIFIKPKRNSDLKKFFAEQNN